MLSISSRCWKCLTKAGQCGTGEQRGWGAVLCGYHCLGFTLLQSKHCVKPQEKVSAHFLACLVPCSSLLCDHLGLWKGTRGSLGLGVVHCSCGNTQAADQGCPCVPTSLQHCHCNVVLQAHGSRVCGWKTQYPTDLFLLPALLQVISDERERGDNFDLTFSLCWVNPEEDGGTQ